MTAAAVGATEVGAGDFLLTVLLAPQAHFFLLGAADASLLHLHIRRNLRIRKLPVLAKQDAHAQPRHAQAHNGNTQEEYFHTLAAHKFCKFTSKPREKQIFLLFRGEAVTERSTPKGRSLPEKCPLALPLGCFRMLDTFVAQPTYLFAY